LAFEIPERHVQAGLGRRLDRPTPPAPGVVHLHPEPLDSGRILADQDRAQLMDRGVDRVDRAVQRRLAPAVKALVGADPDEHPVLPLGPVAVRLDRRDLHVVLRWSVWTGMVSAETRAPDDAVPSFS